MEGTKLIKDHMKPEEPSTEAPSLGNIWKDGGCVNANASVNIRLAGDECLPVCDTEKAHGIAQIYISQKTDAQKRDDSDNISLAKVASIHEDTVEQKLDLTKVSVKRGQLDNLQIDQTDFTPVIHCEISEPICLSANQKLPIQSLVCKQEVQPQSSSATIFCKAESITSVQQSCTQTFTSISTQVSGHKKMQKMVEDDACCSLKHSGAAEDTFNAFCHSQPIPASAQMLPHLTSIQGALKGQKGGPAFLVLPPLVSSISETSLDTKNKTHCCSLDCNRTSTLRQHGNQQQAGKQENRNMKDAGTMTSCRELRDMGVQVGQTDSESSSQHVYPEVCLVEKTENENHKFSAHQKSPVKEVKWDAEGMTWEVYGASVDPEELGLAIQKHLELQIKECAGTAMNPSQQNPNISQLGKEKKQKRKGGVMAVLRQPSVCCSRSTTTAD